MFDIQTSPSRTGLPNHISPKGSWEKQWYALPYTNLEPNWDEKDGRNGTVGRRYEVSAVSAVHEAAFRPPGRILQPTQDLWRCC